MSHDARLLLETECVLWVCGKQDVLIYDRGFEAYRKELLDELSRLEALAQEKRKTQVQYYYEITYLIASLDLHITEHATF